MLLLNLNLSFLNLSVPQPIRAILSQPPYPLKWLVCLKNYQKLANLKSKFVQNSCHHP